MRYNQILVALGELTLKSEPVRRRFLSILLQNIRFGLKRANVKFEIEKTRGRIFIKTRQIKKASEVLRRIFGIAYFAPCKHIKLKNLESFVKENWKEFINPKKTFAVRVRRKGKHEFTSQELAAKLGSYIDAKVNLSNPDQTLYVEVRDQDCYVFTEKIKGLGGMPIGSAGRVVCLISGGIDSAVAAWMMLKRGCEIIALYAENYPYIDKKAKKRFKEIMKVLQKWSVGRILQAYTFNHGKNLEYFVKNARRNLLCLLCKRMMYRMANELAKRVNAKAIVTGESLGEVASQTLDNLSVLDEASELPVFRPLIGFDKKEIIEMAKQIGTYEKSIMLTKGCTIVPRRPRTKGRLEEILKMEEKLNIEKLVEKSIKSLKEVELGK
jgi:thiamine biosynthesis protein ThiI